MLPRGQAAAAARSGVAPGAVGVPTDKDPIALGEIVFRTATPACNACHSLSAGVGMAGPSLAGVATRAQQTIGSSAYTGKAKDVDGYLRESITEPSAHIVVGGMYSTNGVSLMPGNFGKDLTPEQVTQLVAYLTTFK
jgi:nitric oxide reductase subunit C